jgi:exodeoxyribonuclease-5
MITRSNRRAVDFNLAIRQQIFDREEILARGDRLLISKNNYYWTTLARRKAREAEANIASPQVPANVASSTTVAEAEAEASTPQAPPRIPDFLANGEVAIVDEIYATETVDDIRFADVRLWLPEANTDIEAKIVLDSLTAETAGLPRPKIETLAHRALFNAGAEQGSATAQREALKTCPYFNALQVKYAYAVTCHKAQGGQWTSVFVDMGYIPPEAYRTPDFYRWLYTSITRATTSLHLLNPSCLIR